MYSSPSRTPTPHSKRQIPEGPVHDFTVLIETTPSDRWQKRCAALRELVDSIPEGSDYYVNDQECWYNSAPVLRHLAFSISDLLKDPRSTVVKRTCESLTRLFIKCQSDARYLFKDLMPTVLSVHAQTAQVVRNAVQEMVLETIPEVPCKMVMPLWMERLKIDKSRTVREACALYLGECLKSWTDEGYLSSEIWMQVGATLMRTLRDPSVQVRSYAKSALEYIQRSQPGLWEALISDEDGPAASDPKLKKWLRSLGTSLDSPDAEELSVASKFSYNSDTRFARNSAAVPRSSPSSNRRYQQPEPPRRVERNVTATGKQDEPRVPMSINVNAAINVPAASNGPKKTGSGLGPPVRLTATATTTTTAAPFKQAMGDSPVPPSQPAAAESPLRSTAAAGTPPRHPTPTNRASPKPFPLKMQQQQSQHPELESTPSFQADLESKPSFPSDLQNAFGRAADAPKTDGVTGLNTAMSGMALGVGPDEGPFIASMQELKKHAAQRRSRNSIMMQERFRMSGSLMNSEEEGAAPAVEQVEENRQGAVAGKRSEEENEVPNSEEKRQMAAAAASAASDTASGTKSPSVSAAPEHMVIAIRLLRAHKAHVDAIMETLKIEMDTLRDFDRLLEEPGRPSEEEVLDYFESVGLCLDQRTQAGSGLQREMDRISRGEPPQE